MGKIEHIDQLETYISELGKEIKNVKKASDYLRLIEQLQKEIEGTSITLNQSKDQLQLIQEIVNSKLELFHTTARNVQQIQTNIETKLQELELSQNSILASLLEIKQQQEKNDKGIISSFTEMNKLINTSKDTILTEMKRIREHSDTTMSGMSKNSRTYFIINTILSVGFFGVICYLLTK